MEGSDGEHYRYVKKGKNPPKSKEIQNLLLKKWVVNSYNDRWMIQNIDPSVYVYFSPTYEDELIFDFSDILPLSDNPEDGLIHYYVSATLSIEISNGRIKILKRPRIKHIFLRDQFFNVMSNASLSTKEINERIVEKMREFIASFVGLEIDPFAKKDKLKIGDKYCEKIPEMIEVVSMEVCHEFGAIPDNNMSGEFVVAKFGDWDYAQGHDAFVAEFEKRKNKPVDIIIIPLETEYKKVHGSKGVMIEPLELSLPAGRIGADFVLSLSDILDSHNRLLKTYNKLYGDGKH